VPPDASILDLWDPEAVIEEVAEFPDADVYRGHEGLVRWWTAFFEIYDDVQIEPREFIPVGDRVVVQFHQSLRSHEGVELEHDVTNVWTLRDGKAVHVKGFRNRDEALRSVGLGDG
jgi:ketosteroid isomerase-like protein